MKVYYAHFIYGPCADDGPYYSGTDSSLFTTREEADKCGKYTLEHQDEDYDYIEHYIVCESEIFDKFIP